MTIDIDTLTLGQLKQIAGLAGCGTKAATKRPLTPRRVIVRSYGAGVFYGTIVAKRGNEVDMTDCRRIWNWKGANTLSEIALSGLTPKGSRVAKPTPAHTVLDVIEIIDAQPAAIAVLDAAGWEP